MKLLEQTYIANLPLANRMVMAPMTRSRADDNGIVSPLTALYYKQRSTAGLIISEGINISQQAKGTPFTPGIYNQSQIEAWKKVTDTVHEAGGKIFAQLWHSGRVGHSLNKNGELPVSPSAIAIEGQQVFTMYGQKPFETPKALTEAEIHQVILDYKQAAINAIEAGFDGVELHAAFGYLPNEFLVESANKRSDKYGGSIENRSRFVLEVMHELVMASGHGKAGIRLSPSIAYNNIFDSNPVLLYSYLMAELDKIPLAYIHLMQPLFPIEDLPHYPKDVLTAFDKLTKKNLIINGGYQRDRAEKEIEGERAHLVSFGSLFLANPDLPKRFELNTSLNQPDKATMYGGVGEKGYTDYPFLDE